MELENVTCGMLVQKYFKRCHDKMNSDLLALKDCTEFEHRPMK